MAFRAGGLRRVGVLGRSPKRVLVWGPRRDARPAGERRSGGALEGYPKRKRGDPTWSAARDDAYAQKERPGGEPYRLCTLHILRDAFRRPQTIPCRVGIQILISKRPRPAARRLPTWSRISSAAHSSANRSPAPARRDPSPPQNIIIIPSLTPPIKPTIYAILAQ